MRNFPRFVMIGNMRRDMVRLVVTVNVDGAQIHVDGVRRAASPLAEPIEVGPGVHVVEARKEGHIAALQRVNVVAGRSQIVNLVLTAEAAEPTVIRIDSGFVAARALVDGAMVGTTPVEVEVQPGVRRIEVVADGYQAASRMAQVTEGRFQVVSFQLEPLPSEPPAPEPAAGPAAAAAGPPDAPDDEERGSLWWLWTTIGVALAGGAVTAGVLLWPEGDPSYDMRRSVP